MFKNKLSVNADYFYENRHSILVNQSNITPNLIGINLPLYNGGTINNKGVESNIKYNTNFGPVKIFLGVNMMYAKNKIVDLKEIAYPENEAYRYRKGNPINAIFGFEADGIYNNQAEIQEANVLSSFSTLKPGDIKYIDQNNDGIINNADKKVIGNLFPEFIYGINGGFEIKGFDFSFQTEGSEMFDAVIVPGQFSYYAYNNRWVDTQSGSNAKYPRLSFSSDHNLQTSSYWLEKGHLFRLSSLEFGYSFPKQLSKKILANNVRIYAKMNNIFSTSNVREGRNYETPTAGYTVYPEMKSFLAGLSIKF